MNYGDVPKWAVQVACEYLGFKGLWDAEPDDYPEIMDLAERLAD